MNEGRKVDRLKHDFNARAQTGRGEVKHPGTETAGGAGARDFGHLAPGRLVCAFGVVGQGSVEFGDHIGGGALLRPKDCGCAARATEGVVDVAGNGDLAFGETRVEAGDVDFAQVPECCATVQVEVGSRGAEEAYPEGARHAGAAVVGGAAADADDDLAETGV